MFQTTTPYQRAKKVVSDSLGLVDFAVGLVNSVINMPNEQQQQVNFSEKFTLQKNWNNNVKRHYINVFPFFTSLHSLLPCFCDTQTSGPFLESPDN